jgi:hypothetical protein
MELRDAQMKWLWLACNLVIAGLAVLLGYIATTADRVEHTNPNIIFCALVFIATASVGFYQAGRVIRQSDYVIAPSPFRSPFGRDRLQSLCSGTFFWLGSAVGASLRLPGSGTKTFWFAAFVWCLALGLGLGQAVAIFIHRAEINDI